MRPLIAVAGMRAPKIQGLRRDGVAAATRVLESVYRAGGEPVTLFHGDPGDIAARLPVFDGIVLPGGADIDPRRYGLAHRHPETEQSDTLQDDADLAIACAALELRIPLLAICRGMQVLNVATGGSLIQDLPPSGVEHRDAFHEVKLTPGCRTARIMGNDTVSVSSYHHQAVDRTGSGLHITGRAADGCIEVLEHEDAPVTAVQWHPEDDAASAPMEQALFDALIEEARRRRAGSVDQHTAATPGVSS